MSSIALAVLFFTIFLGMPLAIIHTCKVANMPITDGPTIFFIYIVSILIAGITITCVLANEEDKHATEKKERNKATSTPLIAP